MSAEKPRDYPSRFFWHTSGLRYDPFASTWVPYKSTEPMKTNVAPSYTPPDAIPLGDVDDDWHVRLSPEQRAGLGPPDRLDEAQKANRRAALMPTDEEIALLASWFREFNDAEKLPGTTRRAKIGLRLLEALDLIPPSPEEQLLDDIRENGT